MRERTRYRVTGSIFLIAMAVIFLPMLFDDPGPNPTEVPPAPAIVQPASLPDFAEIVPELDTVEQVAKLREEIDESGFSTETQTRFGEPLLMPPDDESTVWAVQAAAFASQENAFAFRDEMREAGYEAFISTINGGDEGPLHRVAVGPLLSETDAERFVTEIAERFSVDPRKMEMAP